MESRSHSRHSRWFTVVSSDRVVMSAVEFPRVGAQERVACVAAGGLFREEVVVGEFDDVLLSDARVVAGEAHGAGDGDLGCGVMAEEPEEVGGAGGEASVGVVEPPSGVRVGVPSSEGVQSFGVGAEVGGEGGEGKVGLA
jgi:hypothetical protein